MQVAGDFRLGETDSAGNAVFARTMGWRGQLIQISGCLGPAILGVLGSLLIGDDHDTYDSRRMIWLVVVFGVLVLPFVVGALAPWLLRAPRLARGATEAAFCRFEAAGEGLRASFDGGDHGLAWRKVTEIMRYRDLWIFVGAANLCLPRRWFADAAAEAAFLDHALSRLSPEALARSRDAVIVRDGQAPTWTGYGQGAEK